MLLLIVLMLILIYSHMFLPDSQNKRQSEIQSLIKAACLEFPVTANKQTKATMKKSTDKLPTVDTENKLQIESNFYCLLSAIFLFVEQEPFYHVPMNLDVNFWHVHQENFEDL